MLTHRTAADKTKLDHLNCNWFERKPMIGLYSRCQYRLVARWRHSCLTQPYGSLSSLSPQHPPYLTPYFFVWRKVVSSMLSLTSLPDKCVSWFVSCSRCWLAPQQAVKRCRFRDCAESFLFVCIYKRIVGLIDLNHQMTKTRRAYYATDWSDQAFGTIQSIEKQHAHIAGSWPLIGS